MKKKFLTLIYIILLHSTSYATSENELPPLPTSEILVSESKDTVSVWTKALNFFGLGSEEKEESDLTSNNNIKDQITEATEVANDISSPIPPTNDQSINILQQEVSDISELKLPDITPDEELPTDKTNVSNIDNNQPISTQDIAKESSKNLKLPDIKPNETLPSKKSDVINNNQPISTQDIVKEDVAILKPKSLPQNLTQVTENQDKTKIIDSLNVKSYSKHIKDRINKSKKLPKISKDDLIQTDLKEDPEQVKFANDESQVLLLPNDEVVLGEVTKESQLTLMDLRSYIKIFWDNYNNIKDEPARRLIDDFVDNYDSNFNTQPLYSKRELNNILIEAFKSIDRNSIYDLMNILDAYPILQLVDHQGNTLLHKSVYKNNYSAAKFLIMKGIDISMQNNQNLTALDISITQKKSNIETLLRTAGAKY